MSDPAGPAAPPSWQSYLTHDARFDVPAGWRDRSMVVLTAPPGVGGAADGEAPDDAPACSLTLHHDALGPGEDLAAYAARQLAQLGGALADFDLLREGPRPVGGAPGWSAEFRWTDQAGLALHQHQVSLVHPAPPAGRVLTWTATALAAAYDDYADVFAAVLGSVRLLPTTLSITVPRG